MKILLLLGLILSGASWAQQCPPGTIGPGCLPPNDPRSPHADSQQPEPSSPRVIWADRWGAIAIDDTNSSVGVAADMASKRKAEKEAMNQCRAKEGSGCRLEVSYGNQCGVIAWGDNFYVTASSTTIEEASETAIQNCNQQTSNCKIYYTNCSLAERVQ